jgi:hypothetical protein
MKNLLAIILTMLLCTSVFSEISYGAHEACKDVKDYVGCVSIFSEKVLSEEEYFEQLDVLGQCNENYKSLQQTLPLPEQRGFSFKDKRHLKKGHGTCSMAKFDISKEGVPENIEIIWNFPDDAYKKRNINSIKDMRWDPVYREGKVIKIEDYCLFMNQALNLADKDTNQYCESFGSVLR